MLFGAVADLAGKLQVRQVRVPVGLEKKAIEDLTDEDYQKIATKAAKLLQANSSQARRTPTHPKRLVNLFVGWVRGRPVTDSPEWLGSEWSYEKSGGSRRVRL